MKFLFRAAVLSALAFAASAYATKPTPSSPLDVSVSAGEKARVTALFEAKTRMKVTDVELSPLGNFFTVVVDAKVYYMETNGKWLFDGHLVDMDTRTSVTAQRQLKLESVALPVLDWRSLNLADAVKSQRGNVVPGRVLVTFEDPNCGFCKKLHPQLEQLTNITIYAFPVSMLGADSQAKNEAIFCASDRYAAWASAMSSLPVKPGKACDVTGLARNGKLAAELKVRGTPTIFFADGTRMPGYADAAALEQRIAAVQK